MSRLDTRSIDGRDLPERSFPEVRQSFRIYLAEEAMDRVTRHGREHPDREVGGVLVGELLRDSGGPFLLVETTIDALHAEEKGTELTFTHATWEHIHQLMDSRHQGRRIVGWYHTHPGFGVFLSDRDQFIQQSFFNLPHQIALVYDPKRHEHGVFIWRAGEPVRCPRYWVGNQECLWEATPAAAAAAVAPREIAAAPRRQRGEEAKSRDPASPGGEPPRSDWAALGLTAVLALTVGMVAGAWWGSRGSARLLEQAQRRIEQERLVAAEEMVRLLDGEVLGYLRRLVDDDAGRRDLELADEALGRVLRSLQQGGGGAAERHLQEARDLLRNLSDTQSRAHQSLRALELLARPGLADQRLMASQVLRQRAALAGLYLELSEQAAAAGDLDRARRLLHTAASFDPGNAAYGQRLRQLEPAAGAEPVEGDPE